MQPIQTTLFLRHFTTLDFAFFDPKQGILGESFYVSAELKGNLDSQGFVLDFGHAKRILKTVVDQSLDHRLAIASETASINLAGENTQISLSYPGGKIEYFCPQNSIAAIQTKALSIEPISLFLKEKARLELPQSISEIRIILEEEKLFKTEANFRYTHGLKMHDGNCQRLFHGHRNLIEVFVNGEKSRKHEAILATLFSNVHFAPKENIENFDALKLPAYSRNTENQTLAKISYKSSQGSFSAAIPASSLIVFEEEPSIERITKFAWDYLVKDHGLKAESLKVYGYEGLQKGAIVSY